MTNFEKHIENVHSAVVKNKKVESECLNTSADLNGSNTSQPDFCSNTEKPNDSGAIIACDSSVEIVEFDVDSVMAIQSNNNNPSYYDQLSAQIT